jgi:methionine synthase reductase
MAKGINDALADILVEHGKIQKPDALKILAQWISDKRYLRDLVRYFKICLAFDFL